MPGPERSYAVSTRRVCIAARIRMYRDGLAEELGRQRSIEVVAIYD
jgi:hypothetical protein